MVRRIAFGNGDRTVSGPVRIDRPAPGTTGSAPARPARPTARFPARPVRRRSRGAALVILAIWILGFGLLATLIADRSWLANLDDGLFDEIAARIEQVTGETERATAPEPAVERTPEPTRPEAEPVTRPAGTDRGQNSGSRGG